MKVKLFSVGTDTAKEMIYSRLKITEPGPGYCHFPSSYDEKYFKQLTAEKLVTRYHKGFPVRRWEKPAGAKNEALDCRVYAIAALHILNPDLERLAEKMTAEVENIAKEKQKAVASITGNVADFRKIYQPARKTGFVKNW